MILTKKRKGMTLLDIILIMFILSCLLFSMFVIYPRVLANMESDYIDKIYKSYINKEDISKYDQDDRLHFKEVDLNNKESLLLSIKADSMTCEKLSQKLIDNHKSEIDNFSINEQSININTSKEIIKKQLNKSCNPEKRSNISVLLKKS